MCDWTQTDAAGFQVRSTVDAKGKRGPKAASLPALYECVGVTALNGESKLNHVAASTR
jgi:hypothetical protein